MDKNNIRNNRIPKEFDIILRNNKKNLNVNTVDINSSSFPHKINGIQQDIKKINTNNLPPLFRKKKMIKSISFKDIKPSLAKINIILDENSIPEEVKVKSFIQHISDLINDRKKNIIKENQFKENNFEKQRKLIEYFDKLPELILNKVQNKINNYYKNYSENNNDIITNNITEIFNSPVIKYKFLEKVINSITHKVNFIDFNTYESYEREVVNTINNEFTKLISIGNQIVHLNLGPYDNSIQPKYIFSVDKFFEKYDSENNTLLKNKEKSLSMSNFRKTNLCNNNNLLNTNKNVKKTKNDIDEIYNLLKKDISIEIKQKLKEEEVEKFKEMNDLKKKKETNNNEEKIFQEKYQNIKITNDEENEILKSKNSNFIKPIYKSKSSSNFYHTKNNLNKTNFSNKNVNYRNNNLVQKKNKDKTKSTMISSIDYSNEKEKQYSIFRNYYDESLNKISRRKYNENRNINSNRLLKNRKINLINRKYFNNFKNKKGSYSNFSKEKKKNISNPNNNNLNNEEAQNTKKSNLDLLLEKIDLGIKHLEIGKKKTEEDEKKIEDKNKKLEDEKKKKEEKEEKEKKEEKKEKKNNEDESLNNSFHIFTKQTYLKFQKNKILLKDLKRKNKSEEKKYIRRKFKLSKEFNERLISNSQNNSIIKKLNIKKTRNKIYLRKFQIFDNEINENLVISSSYKNSKLYEFKKKIKKMKKITIEEYLNYLRENICSIKLFNEPNSEEKRINQFIKNLNEDLKTQQEIYNLLNSKCKVIDKKLIISSSIPFTTNIN